MTYRRAPFDGPYCDHTGIGFMPPNPEGMNWRARSIVTICCNPLELEEAVFLNADGYRVPLEPHPYELRHLLARAESREYGNVEGLGQFAIKPARLNSMASSGQLKRWVIHRLAQPNGYANDPAVWATHETHDLEEERKFTEASYRAAVTHCNRGTELPGVDLPWPSASGAAPAEVPDLAHWLSEAEAVRRAALADKYRTEKTKDDAVSAWLRGDVGNPPLLALMLGAA